MSKSVKKKGIFDFYKNLITPDEVKSKGPFSKTYDPNLVCPFIPVVVGSWCDCFGLEFLMEVYKHKCENWENDVQPEPEGIFGGCGYFQYMWETFMCPFLAFAIARKNLYPSTYRHTSKGTAKLDDGSMKALDGKELATYSRELQTDVQILFNNLHQFLCQFPEGYSNYLGLPKVETGGCGTEENNNCATEPTGGFAFEIPTDKKEEKKGCCKKRKSKQKKWYT